MHLLNQHRLQPIPVLLSVCAFALTGCHTPRAQKGGWPRIEVLERPGLSQISAQVVNIGNAPLRLWSFDARGGWDSLCVLLQDPYTGQRLRLRRMKNDGKGPSPNPAVFVKTIEPGESYRFAIDLHDGTWERRRECDNELVAWDVRLDLEIPKEPRSPGDRTPKQLGRFYGKVKGEWYRSEKPIPWEDLKSKLLKEPTASP